jgi:uncharacterized protein YqjF (DUF2071 family)
VGTALLSTPAVGAKSAAARESLVREGGPSFVSDWLRALFLHYEVPAEALQPFVPFPLDLRDGRAFVDLVAFTMRGLRPPWGGRATAALSAPLSTHGFLNVRTYVRHMGAPGIYFLTEWLPNPLACWIGPRLFGLPYRRGRLDFRHRHEVGDLRGEVVPADGAGVLRWRAAVDPRASYGPAEPGSDAEFLVERYSAFTYRRGRLRLFRVWHEPWPVAAVDAVVEDASAVAATGEWFRAARFVGAHYSPGVHGVGIGPPCVA